MRIFKDVPPIQLPGFFESVDRGAEAVCEAISRVRGQSQTPVSLAELRPDEEDRHWLEQWVQKVGPRSADICLQSNGYETEFGLLFLFALAEYCRGEGNEDEVYKSAMNMPWQPKTCDFLFPRRRAPRQSLKEAIELAARTAQLRHVFDEPDRQRWFATVSLQHGFTFRGAKASLHQWLAGANRPHVIDDLLGSSDPELKSDSFCRLWSALEDRDDQLFDILQESAWVRPEWADELVRAARRRRPRPAGRDSVTSPSSDGIMSPVALTDSEESGHLVNSVRLHWQPGAAPQFRIEIRTPEGEFGKLVSLFADGRRIATWGRQPGDDYVLIERVLPLSPVECRADVSFELVDEAGETVGSQVVPFWSAEEEVAAWDNRGDAVDAWEHVFLEQRQTCLLASDDLHPVNLESVEIEAGPPGFRLMRVAAGTISQFALTLDGEEFWSPLTHEVPRLTHGLKLFTLREEFDPRDDPLVRLHISCAAGWSIRWVRVAGKKYLAGSDDSQSRIIVPVDVLSLPRPWSLPCIVGLRDPGGTARTVRRSIALKPSGLYHDEGGNWKIADLESEVSRSELARPTRVIPPHQDERDRQWTVLAGELIVGRPAPRPAPLRGLAARGESLHLCLEPYNRHEHDPNIRIGGRIIDHGIVEWTLCSDRVILVLDRPIEPQPEHAIYLLYRDGTRVATSRDIVVRNGGRGWEVCWKESFAELDFSDSDPVAVAVGFRGRWLGAWWAHDWSRQLLPASATGSSGGLDPGVVAFSLRWFRFPVLDAAEAVRRFASIYPEDCVRYWLLTTEYAELPGNIDAAFPCDADDSPGWYMAVRTFLQDWWPQPEEADRIIQGTLPDPAERVPPGSLLTRLVEAFRYAPLVLGRVLMAAASHDPRYVLLLRETLKRRPRRELEPFLEDACRWAVEEGVYRGGSGGWRENNLVTALMNKADVREETIRRICEAVADGRLRYEGSPARETAQ